MVREEEEGGGSEDDGGRRLWCGMERKSRSGALSRKERKGQGDRVSAGAATVSRAWRDTDIVATAAAWVVVLVVIYRAIRGKEKQKKEISGCNVKSRYRK